MCANELERRRPAAAEDPDARRLLIAYLRRRYRMLNAVSIVGSLPSVDFLSGTCASRPPVAAAPSTFVLQQVGVSTFTLDYKSVLVLLTISSMQ